MPDRTDVVYEYDGSFEGLMCCVFESFLRHETPCDVYNAYSGTAQATLYPVRSIETDPEKARRVMTAIPRKVSPAAEDAVRGAFLSDQPGIEAEIIRFVKLGFRYGARVMTLLTDDTVRTVTKASGRVGTESHLFKGFLRFSEYGRVLAAIIEPKCRILPYLVDHFTSRYPEEAFLIYDKTHREALVYRPYEAVIVPLQELTLPTPGKDEQQYRHMWKTFYDTIAVEGRTNPRCRMNHMPKWMWKHLTELNGEGGTVAGAGKALAAAPSPSLPDEERLLP